MHGARFELSPHFNAARVCLGHPSNIANCLGIVTCHCESGTESPQRQNFPIVAIANATLCLNDAVADGPLASHTDGSRPSSPSPRRWRCCHSQVRSSSSGCRWCHEAARMQCRGRQRSGATDPGISWRGRPCAHPRASLVTALARLAPAVPPPPVPGGLAAEGVARGGQSLCTLRYARQQHHSPSRAQYITRAALCKTSIHLQS